MHGLTREEVVAVFTLAGIKVLKIKPLPDGYSYSPDTEGYFLELPHQVWWFVKTQKGWIEIGWRKRVIHIDWSDTSIRKILTDDEVTKNEEMVHAWTVAKAIEYLQSLKQAFEDDNLCV